MKIHTIDIYYRNSHGHSRNRRVLVKATSKKRAVRILQSQGGVWVSRQSFIPWPSIALVFFPQV